MCSFGGAGRKGRTGRCHHYLALRQPHLGLAHEHERLDIPSKLVFGFLPRTDSVATKAQADFGYRITGLVANTVLPQLQLIPGFSTVAAVTALKANAKKASYHLDRWRASRVTSCRCDQRRCL